MFEISPDTFVRIELQRPIRQGLQGDYAWLMFNVLAHGHRAMYVEVILNERKLLSDRGVKAFARVDHLQRTDGYGIKPDVQAPQGNSGNRGELLPAKAVTQDQRLTPKSTMASAMGASTQLRHVDQDDYLGLVRRDCSCAGHVLVLRGPITRSSLSHAWLAGCCALETSSAGTRYNEDSASTSPKPSFPKPLSVRGSKLAGRLEAVTPYCWRARSRRRISWCKTANRPATLACFVLVSVRAQLACVTVPFPRCSSMPRVKIIRSGWTTSSVHTSVNCRNLSSNRRDPRGRKPTGAEQSCKTCSN